MVIDLEEGEGSREEEREREVRALVTGLLTAFVAAWLLGTEGQGVADVLFGDYGFTGMLPQTWFKSVDQLPMNVGDPHYDPLYPFGFGLTINSSLPG